MAQSPTSKTCSGMHTISAAGKPAGVCPAGRGGRAGDHNLKTIQDKPSERTSRMSIRPDVNLVPSFLARIGSRTRNEVREAPF